MGFVEGQKNPPKKLFDSKKRDLAHWHWGNLKKEQELWQEFSSTSN